MLDLYNHMQRIQAERELRVAQDQNRVYEELLKKDSVTAQVSASALIPMLVESTEYLRKAKETMSRLEPVFRQRIRKIHAWTTLRKRKATYRAGRQSISDAWADINNLKRLRKEMREKAEQDFYTRPKRKWWHWGPSPDVMDFIDKDLYINLRTELQLKLEAIQLLHRDFPDTFDDWVTLERAKAKQEKEKNREWYVWEHPRFKKIDRETDRAVLRAMKRQGYNIDLLDWDLLSEMNKLLGICNELEHATINVSASLLNKIIKTHKYAVSHMPTLGN